MYIFWNGTIFSVGFPLIVSGALSVVAEKRPTGCLIIISALSHMVSLGVSIAGLVMISSDLSSWQWRRSLEAYCYRSQDYGWPPVTTTSYNNDYRLEECKRVFNEFQNLIDELQIMILLLMVWGLCISLFSLFRLKHLCSGFFVDEESEKEKDPPLLDSSSYKNIEGV
ncbi:uncharacterized protein O3C94_017225 isoform 1-T1 [Discoglossus pictus]